MSHTMPRSNSPKTHSKKSKSRSKSKCKSKSKSSTPSSCGSKKETFKMQQVTWCQGSMDECCEVIEKSTKNDDITTLQCLSCFNKWYPGEVKYECIYPECDNIFCDKTVRKEAISKKKKKKTLKKEKLSTKKEKKTILKPISFSAATKKSRKSKDSDDEYIKPPTPSTSSSDNNSSEISDDDEDNDIIQSKTDKISKFEEISRERNKQKNGSWNKRKKSILNKTRNDIDSDESLNGYTFLKSNNKSDNKSNRRMRDKKIDRKRRLNDITSNDDDDDGDDIEQPIKRRKLNKKQKHNEMNLSERVGKMKEVRDRYIDYLKNGNKMLKENGKQLLTENGELRKEGKKMREIIKGLRSRLNGMTRIFDENVECDKSGNNDGNDENVEDIDNGDNNNNNNDNDEQQQQPQQQQMMPLTESQIAEIDDILDTNIEKEGEEENVMIDGVDNNDNNNNNNNDDDGKQQEMDDDDDMNEEDDDLKMDDLVTPNGDNNDDEVREILNEQIDDMLITANNGNIDIDDDNDENTESDEELNINNRPLQRKKKKQSVDAMKKENNAPIMITFKVTHLNGEDIIDLTSD